VHAYNLFADGIDVCCLYFLHSIVHSRPLDDTLNMCDNTSMDMDSTETTASSLALINDTSLAPNERSTVHGALIPQGITLGQLSTLTFQDVKRDMITRLLASTHDEDKQLAVRAAQATTADELWAVSLAKNTEPAVQMFANSDKPVSEHGRRMQRELEFVKSAQYAEMVEEARRKAFETFAVKNPVTGELEFPDTLSPEQVEKLASSYTVFVAKEVSLDERRKIVAKASFAPPPLSDLPRADSNMETADQAALSDMRQHVDTRTDQVLDARRAVNAIVEQTHAESPYVSVVAAEQPWFLCSVDELADYMPLQKSLVHSAVLKRAGLMQLSLAMSPVYSQCVYTSKLIALITGDKFSHVMSALSAYQLLDAIFVHVLGTNIRPPHAEFLDKELEAAHKMHELARASNDTEAMRFTAAFAAGIGESKRAWSSEPRQLVSPYSRLFEMPVTADGTQRWKVTDIMRHSKDEIARIVSSQKQARYAHYCQALSELEQQRIAQPVGITQVQFIDRLYELNHVLAVELLNCYELGIMMLYEDIMPANVAEPDGSLRSLRAELKTPVDWVTADKVPPQMAAQLVEERAAYAKLRDHVRHSALERLPTSSVSYAGGFKLTYNSLPDAPIDVAIGACSPTYKQFARFYNTFNIDYGNQQNFESVVTQLDSVITDMRSSRVDVASLTEVDRYLHDRDMHSTGNGDVGSQSKIKRLK